MKGFNSAVLNCWPKGCANEMGLDGQPSPRMAKAGHNSWTQGTSNRPASSVLHAIEEDTRLLIMA